MRQTVVDWVCREAQEVLKWSKLEKKIW